MNPVVSICCITYNHEKFINEAIDSFLVQKINFQLEIVIGEDFSTDGTREICEGYVQKYPHIIKLMSSEKNLGMIPNFLRTLYTCQGKYIALCEGDDYWIDPYKLQKQVDFLERNNDYVMTFHGVEIVNETQKLYAYPAPAKQKLTLVDLLLNHYIPTASLLFRNGVLPKKFPHWFMKSRMADIPIELMLADKGLTWYFSDKMGAYRRNQGSITQNAEQIQMGRASYLHIFKHLNIYFNYKYWLPFTYMILRTKLGYIKDIFKFHFF